MFTEKQFHFLVEVENFSVFTKQNKIIKEMLPKKKKKSEIKIFNYFNILSQPWTYY